MSAAEPWQGEWEKNVKVECDGEADVECLWSGFSDWSDCSSSCGEGLQARKRKVLQSSQNEGLDCVGQAEEKRKCQSEPCPGKREKKKKSFFDDISLFLVLCTWAEFGRWSECSETCGD